MSGREDLKLDINVVDVEGGARALALLNFNIPYNIVENNLQYQNVLSDVSQFLETQILSVNVGISFQVSATYYLVNRRTGEERFWSGSFNYTAREAALLSGQQFLPYTSRANFLRDVTRCTTEEHILACLQWQDRDTDWTFLRTNSVVLSCQAILSRQNEFFQRNNLLDGAAGRFRRAITRFHPW